jgi:hypothetical protein
LDNSDKYSRRNFHNLLKGAESMAKKNKVICVRVDERLYGYYAALADSRKRKLADVIRLLLEENFQKGVNNSDRTRISQ